MTTTSKTPCPTRTPAPDSSARTDQHRERGMSTLLALAAIIVALGVGAVYGQPYLSSSDTPIWVKNHLPTTTTTTEPASELDRTADVASEADIEGDTAAAVPFLRAGRHDGYDRIVLNSVSGCSIDEPSTWAGEGATWVHIRCVEAFDGLVFAADRPVDAGLENVIDWEVEDDGTVLVLEVDHAADASIDATGSTSGTWVLDIGDAA